jgi:UDP-N-acetylmuramate dehydrogenase
MACWVAWAREHELPWLVLGRGSNVLVSDHGYDGLVLVYRRQEAQANGLSAMESENGTIRLRADAGISLAGLSRWCGERGYTGLEWACGIPGTLGGAVAGNAGAFGGSMAGVVWSAEALVGEGLRRRYDHSELGFAYRSCSAFGWAERSAVLCVELGMSQGAAEVSRAMMAEYRQGRRATQPRGRSAGCAFRNPEGVSAGALIDRCGLKGLAVGDAVVSEQHANFIINRGEASADHVLRLLGSVRSAVRERFGVELETEIRLVGDMALEAI